MKVTQWNYKIPIHKLVFNYLYIIMKPLEICGHIFFSGGEDMCIIDVMF